MEVHHHPDLQHKRKAWKEYFLEFLMIFMAVTLGFFAESLREHNSEQHREAQYMRSMLTDLQNDSAELAGKEKQLKPFPSSLGRLAKISCRPVLSDSDQSVMYDLNLRCLGTQQVYFSEKTANQLKYSDGLRLIKNTKVADAIAAYWQGIEDIRHTNENYENYRKPLRQLSFKIFNYTLYKEYNNTRTEFTIAHPQLANKDALLLGEYGSQTWLLASNIGYFYIPAIAKQKAMAVSLIYLIKKEYVTGA